MTLLTIQEVASIYRTCQSSIRVWIAKGEFPSFIKQGRNTLFLQSELDIYNEYLAIKASGGQDNQPIPASFAVFRASRAHDYKRPSPDCPHCGQVAAQSNHDCSPAH